MNVRKMMTMFLNKEIIRPSSIIIVAALMLHFWGYLSAVSKLTMYSGAIFIGFLFGCRSVLFTKRKYELNLKEHYDNPLLKRMLLDHLQDAGSTSANRTPTLVSRSVDNIVKEIIDNIIRDHIKWWYKDLVMDEDKVYKIIRQEIWIMLGNLKERLKKMDDVKFFTNDIVVQAHLHLQRIKEASNGSCVGGEKEPFELSVFFESPEAEIEHLRMLTDFFLVMVLPVKYAQCKPLRHLLREVLACLVFYPAIEMVCDPDYINQKFVAYIQWQQEEMAKHSRPYTYAKNFKDFVQLINKSSNIESLKCMRYCIVTEIMHATTINNLKRSKGIDVDKEFKPQTSAKGDLLQARNLKRYINQLDQARRLCERRMKLLSNSNASLYGSGENIGVVIDNVNTETITKNKDYEADKTQPGKQVLSFSVIMESDMCRKYFSEHLQKHEQKSLLGFWEMVQEMKTADKFYKHKLANEIIQIYVNIPNPLIKSKPVLKGMEAYLMANKGPEAFYQAQESIYKELEERFYPTFIVSSMYHKMLVKADKLGLNFSSGSVMVDEPDSSITVDSGGEGENSRAIASMNMSNHPSLAVSLLQQTQAKLADKKQALQTFSSSNIDSKMVSTLKSEIKELESIVEELHRYIDRTNIWANYLGLWRAAIVDIKAREHERPIDVILFVKQERSSPSDLSVENWNIFRTISDFHSLQQKLIIAAPWLKKYDLPSPNKPRFLLFDHDTYLKKVEDQLQAFISAVLDDEKLSTSEAVYEFLVTVPEIVKNALPQSKKTTKFSIMQFFRSSQGSGPDDSSDDELLFLDEVDSKDDKKDSIAEPLYALIGEIFELKGLFSVFRRTLITFVQISFGKTINKQLRETVSWISSEPMLHYYLNLFRDSFWKNGKPVKRRNDRSYQDKEATKKKAKAELFNNIPEVLINLVGQQNARTGMSKVFDSLQDIRLNKQLFHDLLEAFFYEFAPELRQKKDGH